ncbi:MAG: hypothetical protein K2M34_02740 [Alphaproteobacteria bacterium]|nr:hypothetical protein [Alphaproteobacteria bacterium]
MNPKLKKEIKEWLEIIAWAAVGGVVVFHVNGLFAPKNNDTEPQKPEQVQVAEKPIQSDTIVQQVLGNAKQLKR